MQSPPVTQSPVLRRTLQQDGIAGAGRFAYLKNPTLWRRLPLCSDRIMTSARGLAAALME
jgi:hypothetical protein